MKAKKRQRSESGLRFRSGRFRKYVPQHFAVIVAFSPGRTKCIETSCLSLSIAVEACSSRPPKMNHLLGAVEHCGTERVNQRPIGIAHRA
jgi:hypothetical protein